MSREDQRVLCANSDTLEPCTVGNLIRVLGCPTIQRELGRGKRKGKNELQEKRLKGSVMHDEV